MSSKKVDLSRDFVAVVYLSESPSLPRFSLGGAAILEVLNLKPQIQSVKLMQNVVSNLTKPPYSPSCSLFMYIQYTYSHREEGEGGRELNQRKG